MSTACRRSSGAPRTSDVVLFDPQRRAGHARLRKSGSDYLVEDLQEANPTVVNDRMLTGPRRLADGDLIVVGGVVLLVEESVPTQRGELDPEALTQPPEAVTARSSGPSSRQAVVRTVPVVRASEVGRDR